MTAPRYVLAELGAYEECLSEAQRLYRCARDAPAPERAAAWAAYAEALQKARELGAKVSREWAAAHAA